MKLQKYFITSKNAAFKIKKYLQKKMEPITFINNLSAEKVPL